RFPSLTSFGNDCSLQAGRHGDNLRRSTPSPTSSDRWTACRLISARERRNTCGLLVMAGNVLVDAGFVVALLSNRDTHHGWAATQAPQFAPPWSTCEAALAEAFHLVGVRGAPSLIALLRRRSVLVAFNLAKELKSVLKLMQKYSDVPMS